MNDQETASETGTDTKVAPFTPSHCALSIIHLARDIANALGLAINPWDANQIPGFAAQVQAVFGRPRNAELTLQHATEIPGVTRRLVQHGGVTPGAPPVFLNEPPQALPPAVPMRARGSDIHLVTIEGGALCNIGCVPIAFAADGKTMVKKCSSNYAGLIYYYDFSFADFLQAQPYVDATVFALYIDVGPDNYCHWMVDFLPRLAHLRQQLGHEDIYIATPANHHSLSARNLAPVRVRRKPYHRDQDVRRCTSPRIADHR